MNLPSMTGLENACSATAEHFIRSLNDQIVPKIFKANSGGMRMNLKRTNLLTLILFIKI